MIGVAPEGRHFSQVFVPNYTSQTNGLRADYEMDAS
jgi:hypothetical protein